MEEISGIILKAGALVALGMPRLAESAWLAPGAGEEQVAYSSDCRTGVDGSRRPGEPGTCKEVPGGKMVRQGVYQTLTLEKTPCARSTDEDSERF